MKPITRLVLFSLLLIGTGESFSQGTTLIIFSEKGETFTLNVNGDQQNQEPSNRVETANLYGPAIKVELYPENPQLSIVKKSLFNTPNTTLYYVFKPDTKGRYILEKTNHDWNGEISGEISSPPPPPPPGNETKKGDADSGHCKEPLSYGEFQVSLEALSYQPFDGPKLTSAKNLVKKKCLTSEQVAEILYAFDNEPTRLQFAKYAYTLVYDPVNYNEVRDVLDPLSAKALDDFIKDGK